MITTNRIFPVAAAAVLLTASIAHGAPAPVALQLMEDAHHRAIFCGYDGTETSARYAEILARDLRRLESTGRMTAESLAYIRAEACGAPPAR